MEELESKVAELQAAVNGLTEELVETKERLRQVEDANDVEVPSRAPRRRGDWEPEDEEEESVEAEPIESVDDDDTKTDESEMTDEDDGESADDDIIVA
ncbi:chromosome segregation protein SMC [Haloferax mediterranei ATCC 33500]|uniref:Chromosome segregation protein SMC n=1 Tax=Haloferax mediterranei (strain ATCC 33500 / DSM 1411 / JCM 8866 / NBRC 14739 / NCIMB 2177 / R-4) TaxID=523841 RepID=M0J2V9_HALMT|nr:smc operon protein [Haloferax mediterranei ATCC 33500]QCQ76608.1 chromosome segregation protein SMC [Haloferax mediterranei ATCC 33500]